MTNQRETTSSVSSSPKTGARHGTVPSCMGYNERKFALEYDQVLRNFLQGDPDRPRSLTEDGRRRLSTVQLVYSESSVSPAGQIPPVRTSKVHDGVMDRRTHSYPMVSTPPNMIGSFPSPQYNGDSQEEVVPIGNAGECRQCHARPCHQHAQLRIVISCPPPIAPANVRDASSCA